VPRKVSSSCSTSDTNNICIATFNSLIERQDESVWDELYQSTLILAKSFDISESMPRRCDRQTTRINHTAETPKQYWRISLYYPSLDHLITDFESSLFTSENHFHAQHLLPRAVDKINDDHVVSICQQHCVPWPPREICKEEHCCFGVRGQTETFLKIVDLS